MKAFGYVRVSSEEQVEGQSPEFQRAKIEAMAIATDLTLERIYADDGISGKSMTNRPGLLAALEAVKKVNGTLIVYSLSRLARSTLDHLLIAADLDEHDCQFVSCHERIDTSTPAGRMYFTIMAAFCQFERETINERCRDGIANKRRKLESLGSIPFGFRALGDQLIPQAREFAALRAALRDRVAGDSYAEIARSLQAHFGPPRTSIVDGDRVSGGGAWDRGQVRRMLMYYLEGHGRLLLEAHADKTHTLWQRPGLDSSNEGGEIASGAA